MFSILNADTHTNATFCMNVFFGLISPLGFSSGIFPFFFLFIFRVMGFENRDKESMSMNRSREFMSNWLEYICCGQIHCMYEYVD